MGTVHPALLTSSMSIKHWQNRFQGISEQGNQNVHGRSINFSLDIRCSACSARAMVRYAPTTEVEDGTGNVLSTASGIFPDGPGDPRWYSSNQSVPLLRDCWTEAQAILLECPNDPAGVELRLCSFTGISQAEWNAVQLRLKSNCDKTWS
jgi:hypothetical protein